MKRTRLFLKNTLSLNLLFTLGFALTLVFAFAFTLTGSG
jgi:hypothetical protein